MIGKYYIMVAIAATALMGGCSNSSTPNNSGNTNKGANNTVFDALYIGNALYVAGDFDSIGGVWTRGLGEWNGSAWSNIDGPLPDFETGTILALATDGTNLYLGGNFLSTIGNTNLSYTAEWTGTAWKSFPAPPGIGFTGEVNQMAFGNSLLYVADNEQQRLSKYDGSAWTDLSLSSMDSVTSFAIANGAMYASYGSYNTSNDMFQGVNLWKYDGSNWSKQGGMFVTSAPLGPNVKLAVSGSDIYAAGDFSAVGSTQLTSYGVAKWDGTRWTSVGTLSGTNKVTAIAVDPSGNVYLGGRNALMEYNGTTWATVATTGGGFANAGTIRSIAVTSNHLAIGGDFTSVNGATANYISILR